MSDPVHTHTNTHVHTCESVLESLGAAATEPENLRAQALPVGEATTTRSVQATMKGSPRSPQLEKALTKR